MADQAWRTTAQSSLLVDRIRLEIAAGLPMPGYRRPCRCFHGRPYPTAIVAVPAAVRHPWVWKAVADVEWFAQAAWREQVATSCSSAGVLRTLALVGSRLVLLAGSSSFAELDTSRSKVPRKALPAAGKKERAWPARGCQTEVFQLVAAAGEDSCTAGEETWKAVEAG